MNFWGNVHNLFTLFIKNPAKIPLKTTKEVFHMSNEFENLKENQNTASEDVNSTADNSTAFNETADVTPIENVNDATNVEGNTNNIADAEETAAQSTTMNIEENANDDTSSKEEKKIKYSYKKSIAAGLAGVVLCGGSLGFCLGLGLNTSKALTNAVTGGFSFDNTSPSDSSEATATAANLVASDDSIAQVVSGVENSIVNISIKAQSATTWFGQTYESEGSGSGIIYKVDGDTVYIITNNHVVEDATSVTVSITGNEQVNAKLVGKDAASDLAVISVSKTDLANAGITDVKAAKFGNSDNMQVGETVIPIGNALGQGKTATLGIISAQNKEINIDGKTLTVIQTDAAINPGNSGGALVNTAGEVIGINTAKLSSDAVEGIGYAIPISTAQPIIESLMENGTIDKPYLGIQGYTIDENFEKIYGINIPGIFISKVEENSAAENAGLQATDIITAIDGTAVADIDTLSNEISKHKSGDSITLTIIRNGSQQMTVTATLQNQNEQF